jgi:hypothetical protein
MKYYININGHVRELTSEEIAERQAQAEADEREQWAGISYEEAVDREIRKRYPQRAVEAIINNYLSCPENTDYVREFLELQAYRAQCKAYVKEMFAKYGRTEDLNGQS